jgi:hypothetical protein
MCTRHTLGGGRSVRKPLIRYMRVLGLCRPKFCRLPAGQLIVVSKTTSRRSGVQVCRDKLRDQSARSEHAAFQLKQA